MVRYRVIYEVEEIRGACPVYKEGDKIVIDSQYPTEVINLEESSAVCLRALEEQWSRLIFQWGRDRIVKHVSGVAGECRIQCPMPGEPYTPCGTVIFRIRREKLG